MRKYRKSKSTRSNGYFNVHYTVLLGMMFSCLTFLGMYILSDHKFNEVYSINIQLNDQIESDANYYQDALNYYKEESSDYEQMYSDEVERRLEAESNQVITISNDYTKDEVYILAKCVQCEAGEGNPQSQKMITKVILNRVASKDFPNTIEEVIYDKRINIQFSVAYNGMMDSCSPTYETLSNVYSVLLFDYDLPSNVQYFYSEDLKSDNWVKTLPIYKTVEGTVFAYKE